MFIVAVLLLLAAVVLFAAAGCGAGSGADRPRFVPQWWGVALLALAALALLVASHVALR